MAKNNRKTIRKPRRRGRKPITKCINIAPKPFVNKLKTAVDKRIVFPKDVKTNIWKKTGKICACCGKKLKDISKVTVEHVIPLSRGGTNDATNLIALCETCNKEKSNVIYIPTTYYLGLKNKPLLKQLEKDFVEWFKPLKEEFDLERYPLISPRLKVVINRFRTKKSLPYIKELTYEWQLMVKEDYNEIQRVTGTTVDQIRKNVNKINGTSVNLSAIYKVKRYSNDKSLAYFSILYDKLKHNFVVYHIWTNPELKDKELEATLLYGTAKLANLVLTNIALEDVKQYKIATDDLKALQPFYTPWQESDAINSMGCYESTSQDSGVVNYVIKMSRGVVLNEQSPHLIKRKNK